MLGLQYRVFYFTVIIFQTLMYDFIKDTFMQMEKALINDGLRVSKVSIKFCIPAIVILWKTLRLNKLKTRTVTSAKISVFVICVEAIMYLFYIICRTIHLSLFLQNIVIFLVKPPMLLGWHLYLSNQFRGFLNIRYCYPNW